MRFLLLFDFFAIRSAWCGTLFFNVYSRLTDLWIFIFFHQIKSHRGCSNLFSYSMIFTKSDTVWSDETISSHRVKGWDGIAKLILSRHNEMTPTRALTFPLTPSYKMRKTIQLWLDCGRCFRCSLLLLYIQRLVNEIVIIDLIDYIACMKTNALLLFLTARQTNHNWFCLSFCSDVHSSSGVGKNRD